MLFFFNSLGTTESACYLLGLFATSTWTRLTICVCLQGPSMVYDLERLRAIGV
jgi:hypothetical protein